MKEYEGRKILKQISGRLVAEDISLPDCICDILLTEDILYVLEDEFNGEYTAHFKIPCNRIECVEKYRNTETGGSSNEINPSKYAITALVGLIGGLIVLPSKKGAVSKCTEYLRVIFDDKTGEKQQVYFSEVSGSIEGFIKAFNNI